MKLVLKSLEAEVAKLEHELVHELPKELKKALAHGDLRENAEYQTAKERKDFVQARIAQLKKRLADLSLLKLDDIPEDKVSFGSTVTVFDVDRGMEITYKLVTSEESDISQGLISTTSPIGRGLMGKVEGDYVEIPIPAGRKRLEIKKLKTIHQE